MPRDAEQARIDQIRPLLDDLEVLIQTPDPEIALLQAELDALEDALTSTEDDLVAAEAEIERLRARIRELESTPPDPDPDPDPNPNPSTGEIPGLPILGICVNGDTDPGTDAWLRTLRSLSEGSMWYRHGYAYSGNDPYNGARDRLAKMRQFDFKVLCRLSLGSNPSKVTAAQYAQHVRRVAQAAKDAGWSANDIVFEYHNEYNGGAGTAQHYVNMAKAAYPVLKSIDPNYRVIGASENVFNSNWQSWLDEVYRLGFGAVTDGLSWHNYAPQTQHKRTNEMYAILTKYGQRNKMIWMTETGASTRKSGGNDGGPNTPENGVSYQGQARRIVGLAQDIGANHKSITHMFIYADLDRPSIADEHEAKFGIWENTSTPKPAVQAIKNLYRT